MAKDTKARILAAALELFSNYAPEDIENALLDTESQIALLNNIYTRLHDVLKNVTDINNSNAYVEFSADKAHEPAGRLKWHKIRDSRS